MMYGLCLSLKNEIVDIAPRGRVNVVAPGRACLDPSVCFYWPAHLGTAQVG